MKNLNDPLNDLYREFQIGPFKLGKAKSKTDDANEHLNSPSMAKELAYDSRKEEIIKMVKDATATRGKNVELLNFAFYAIIALMVLSVIIQFFKNSNILAIVQAVCAAVLFPVSRYVEHSVTKQSYMELVAAFLPELPAGEAIKAIDVMYTAVNNTKDLKAMGKV